MSHHTGHVFSLLTKLLRALTGRDLQTKEKSVSSLYDKETRKRQHLGPRVILLTSEEGLFPAGAPPWLVRVWGCELRFLSEISTHVPHRHSC